MGSILCIPVFEPLFWTGCSYLVVRSIQDQRPKLWLAVGALAGIGLLNKHTMLLWGAGLAIGLLATPARAELRRPWPWLGGLIALAIFLPNLIWQHHNGWATLEFIRAIGKHADRFVILLDPDRAFDVDEMALLCEASQEAVAA